VADLNYETLPRDNDGSCNSHPAQIVGDLAEVSLDSERRCDGGERAAIERRPWWRREGREGERCWRWHAAAGAPENPLMSPRGG
jgi:hypothetical protein